MANLASLLADMAPLSLRDETEKFICEVRQTVKKKDGLETIGDEAKAYAEELRCRLPEFLKAIAATTREKYFSRVGEEITGKVEFNIHLIPRFLAKELEPWAQEHGLEIKPSGYEEIVHGYYDYTKLKITWRRNG